MDYKRIATGVVLAIVAVLVVFLFNSLWFNFFIGLVVLLACYEWCNLFDINHPLMVVAFFVIVAGLTYFLRPVSVLVVYLATLWWWIMGVAFVFASGLQPWLWLGRRSLMLPLGIGMFVALWLSASVAQNQHPFVLFYIILCVCMTDVSAYFIGKYFGKRKLCPQVSPKKTVVGLFGGIVVAEIFAVCVGSAFDFATTQQYIVLYIIMFFVIVISVFGDLFESMLKRQVGVKDSSQLLPGHGGVLDRIDSLVAALPVAIGLFYVTNLPII